jgi:hypothetical protein
LSAPDPSVIERLAVITQANLHKAVFDYSYLYPSAFDRARHGGGERVSTGAEPDLSDLMVGNVSAVRRDLEQAARELFEAVRRIEIAQARLNDAASRLDQQMPVEAEQHERAIAHPADRGDVERAKKAQGRRLARMVNRAAPWSRDEVVG